MLQGMPHPRPRILLFVALAFALLLPGCGAGPLDAYKIGLTVSTSAYEATNAAWTKQKAVEREACLAPPIPPAESPACIETVIARWVPRSTKLRELYAALTSAGLILAILETSEAMKRPLDTAPLEKAIAAVLDAAQAVQAVSP